MSTAAPSTSSPKIASAYQHSFTAVMLLTAAALGLLWFVFLQHLSSEWSLNDQSQLRLVRPVLCRVSLLAALARSTRPFASGQSAIRNSKSKLHLPLALAIVAPSPFAAVAPDRNRQPRLATARLDPCRLRRHPDSLLYLSTRRPRMGGPLRLPDPVHPDRGAMDLRHAKNQSSRA